MAAVRILGIDPGTRVVGYACLEVDVEGPRRADGALPIAMRGSNVIRASSAAAGVRLLAAGVLRLGGRDDVVPDRLLALSDQFRTLLQQFEPGELAIEEAFHGKSAQAALRIGEARGVVLAESARARLGVFQFAPARVKRCVTGNGAAGKESVAAMIRQLIGGVRAAGTTQLPLDATDAMAVAWTRLEQRRSPLLHLVDE